MKKILFLLLVVFTFSCTTVEKMTSPTSGEYLANAQGYDLLETFRTRSESKEIMFLFIPFGGKGVETMKNECFNEMLKANNADGIFNQTYIFTITRYPFFRKTVTELSGRPYKLKPQK